MIFQESSEIQLSGGDLTNKVTFYFGNSLHLKICMYFKWLL